MTLWWNNCKPFQVSLFCLSMRKRNYQISLYLDLFFSLALGRKRSGCSDGSVWWWRRNGRHESPPGSTPQLNNKIRSEDNLREKVVCARLPDSRNRKQGQGKTGRALSGKEDEGGKRSPSLLAFFASIFTVSARYYLGVWNRLANRVCWQ